MPLKPNEINHLNVVSFETNFTRLPNVNFFCQTVNIPSMAIGLAQQPTLFSDISVEGDKVVFEQLNIGFFVAEDLSNYLEIYNWIISLGFPDNAPQFNLAPDILGAGTTADTLKSDMNIILNTNKSNPNFKVTFKDAFPVSLGSIDLDATSSGLAPIVVSSSFAYTGSPSIEKL